MPMYIATEIQYTFWNKHCARSVPIGTRLIAQNAMPEWGEDGTADSAAQPQQHAEATSVCCRNMSTVGWAGSVPDCATGAAAAVNRNAACCGRLRDRIGCDSHRNFCCDAAETARSIVWCGEDSVRFQHARTGAELRLPGICTQVSADRSYHIRTLEWYFQYVAPLVYRSVECVSFFVRDSDHKRHEIRYTHPIIDQSRTLLTSLRVERSGDIWVAVAPDEEPVLYSPGLCACDFGACCLPCDGYDACCGINARCRDGLCGHDCCENPPPALPEAQSTELRRAEAQHVRGASTKAQPKPPPDLPRAYRAAVELAGSDAAITNAIDKPPYANNNPVLKAAPSRPPSMPAPMPPPLPYPCKAPPMLPPEAWPPAWKAAPLPPPGPYVAAPLPPPDPPPGHRPSYVAQFMGRGMAREGTRSMPDLHGIKSRVVLERYWTRMFELEEQDRHIENCRDPDCRCQC